MNNTPNTDDLFEHTLETGIADIKELGLCEASVSKLKVLYKSAKHLLSLRTEIELGVSSDSLVSNHDRGVT